MKTLARVLKTWRWRLGIAAGMGVLQTFVLLPIPFLLRYAFDRAIPTRDTTVLIGIGVAMIGLQALSALIAFRARVLALSAVKRVVHELRGALLARWFELPRTRYAVIEPSVMHDRIVHDTERIDVMVTACVTTVLPAAILMAGVGAILFWLSPTLTFAIIGLGPLAMLVSHRLRRDLRAATRTNVATFERFNRGMWVALEATDLTNIEAAAPRQLRRHGEVIDAVYRDSSRVSRVNSAVTNTHGAITMVIGGVILVVGGLLLARGRLSLGDLVSFYGALALLRSSGNMVLAAVPTLFEGSAAADRLDAVMVEPPVPDYTGTERITIGGRVDLERVVFGYDARPILTDVDLRLEPGDVVGLSGDSGAGKTTIAMLLLGLYRPASGHVQFDGRSLEILDVAHLRGQIGMMPQDPLILPDTVLNNVTFGLADDIPDRLERIAAATALADIDEFVSNLPNGYETVLGTRGINLSGGQRQRIALARALVKRPRILILDEPTNHLGTATVIRVLDVLAHQPAPPTVLIISHDPELLGHLPTRWPLSEGKLVLKSALAKI